MKKLITLLTFISSLVNAQVVNNVRVVDHIGYVTRVIQETMSEVEQREWCNLKLSDFSVDVNDTVIDTHYKGTVTYSNGFVVSIQSVDIQQSTVTQIWSWNSSEGTGNVALRGTLRFLDLTIGYDVVADMTDGLHRYTSTFKHPLISFVFTINYNTHTEALDVTVVGTVPRVTTVIPDILPKDSTSEVLTALFDSTMTSDGINAWGSDVFQPISLEVVTSKVKFPRICYDCPIQ